MTAEGYKTFINGSVMASFMEGIVASILEEKSGAGYGTNCSQLNTVISVIEAMYLCEGMWLFPFCAEDRFFNQPSCIYARAKPRRAKYTHRTKLRFVLCVFRSARLSRHKADVFARRVPMHSLTGKVYYSHLIYLICPLFQNRYAKKFICADVKAP